ncbi:MAG: penicillin-binding transpeptidase domain-containing protein, partial [Armatimonadetes bacterium]|nr:penicillin-binding transpeptidase domain-containing protein [Armatimonadota bacterium]
QRLVLEVLDSEPKTWTEWERRPYEGVLADPVAWAGKCLEYGADLVYRGGLIVHTTLNYEMQTTAEQELRKGVAAAKSRRVGQGALICIDPQTGYIKAMVGGVNPDFTKDQYNRAVQARRQPGSAFKAFVYTAAVDNGYDPYYRVSNAPITYKGKPWPQNYNRRQSARSYTMIQAVAQSVNRCAVNMTRAIGTEEVITYARMLGIRSPISPGLALALGASGVSPLELCSAYGVFAAKGMRAEPMAIVRINESDRNSDGAVIKENRPAVHQVLSEQTAETMGQLFRAVVTMGTGTNAGSIRDAHGKTGTTQDDRDAWFVGYTPELVTAVWVGNDNYTPMRSVWGGNVCAPTWTAFMRKALEVHKHEVEETASGVDTSGNNLNGVIEPRNRHRRTDTGATSSDRTTVTICVASGLLATRACPTTYRVTYDVGKEPLTYCTIHRANTQGETPGETTPQTQPSPQPTPTQTPPGPPRPGTPSRAENYVNVTICVDSGNIANEYCPETITRRFLASEAPTRVCRLHKGE